MPSGFAAGVLTGFWFCATMAVFLSSLDGGEDLPEAAARAVFWPILLAIYFAKGAHKVIKTAVKA